MKYGWLVVAIGCFSAACYLFHNGFVVGGVVIWIVAIFSVLFEEGLK